MRRAVLAGGIRLEYTLVQSVGKRVTLKALPGGELRVYAPGTMKLCDIDAVVREHAAQLLEMSRRVDAAVNEKLRQHPVTDGAPICVEGRDRRLTLHMGEFAYLLMPDALIVHTLNIGNDLAVRADVKRALAELAVHRIRERLQVFAPQIGVTYNRVTIREQKTRWGSCSSKNNLNFNWKLIMAPPEALDYVVIHELCHLIELNHSPRFWRLVESHMPEYKYWKLWLSQHGEELAL